jgi:hypothetical protein
MSLNPTRLTADPAVVAVVHYGPSNLNSMTYIPIWENHTQTLISECELSDLD